MISGQTTGYIVVDGKKILVLARATYNKKYNYGYTSLRIRKSGKDGVHFVSEEDYITQNKKVLRDLLDGKTVKC